MRQVRKTTLSIMIILLLTTIFRCEFILANPIPPDINWETSPFPNNYNGSIIFEQEYINVIFDKKNVFEKNAYVIANYTFKNPEATACNLTLFIPFLNINNDSYKPKISELLLDGIKIDYNWINKSEIFSSLYYDTENYIYFCIIELCINFNDYERKTVQINYFRDYLEYNDVHRSDIYYRFMYFIGSSRLWNHSLKSAIFEFWVPKTICDEIHLPDNSASLGNNVSNLIEYDTYYFVNIKYENWSLPIPTNEREIQPDGRIRYMSNDFIILTWTKKKPFDPLSDIKVFWFVAIVYCTVIILSVVFVKRWSEKNITKTKL